MKRAYHDICLKDGTLQEGPVVVETDDDGHFLSWHLLEDTIPPASELPYYKRCTSSEEPFVEWQGGTYLIEE